MNKTFIFLSICLCITTCTFAQKIIRSSFSTFGNATQENGATYRQTIGQASSTSTLSNDKTTLRQGFQQPVTSEKSNTSKIKECTLYLNPNPATDIVHVKIAEETGPSQLSVFDMRGVLYLKMNLSTSTFELDVNKLPRGVYLINVTSNSGYHCNQKLVVI